MFWADEAEFARMKRLITVFEEQNPGIRVEPVRVLSRKDYLGKVTQELSKAPALDVFALDLSEFAEFKRKGMLRDLSGWADDLFDFQPRLVECFFRENKLWAVPASCSTQVLYYNKRKFDRAGIPYPTDGWDWGDLRQAAERLTMTEGSSAKVIQYGLDLDPGVSAWAPFLWQNGGELFDPDTGRWMLGSPAMLEKNAAALQFYADLIHQSHVAQAKSTLAAADSPEPSFKKSVSAMIFAGRSLAAELQKDETLGWDVCPMPKNLKRATTLSVEGYGISRVSRHADEAWKLVRFLTGPTSQTKMAMDGKHIPARVSAGQSRVFLEFPGKLSINNRAFIDSLFYARPVETAPRWPEVSRIIAEETDLMFSSGKLSARDSLIRAQNRIDSLMAGSQVPRLAAPSERKTMSDVSTNKVQNSKPKAPAPKPAAPAAVKTAKKK